MIRVAFSFAGFFGLMMMLIAGGMITFMQDHPAIYYFYLFLLGCIFIMGALIGHLKRIKGIE